MMKTISKKDKLAFFFINLMAMFFTLTICKPIYETDDDFCMSATIAGCFGESYRSFLIFSNNLLGKLCVLLSNIVGRINWYVLLQYGIIFVVTISIAARIGVNQGKSIGFIANVLLWILVTYRISHEVQFTRTAYVATLGGGILLDYYLKKDKLKIGILGSLLCLAGLWYREKCFYISIAYLGLFFLCNLKEYKFNKQKVILLALTALALAGSWGYNKYEYSTDEWKEYSNYNVARSNLLDYTIPSYDEYSEQYEKLNWSANDVNLLERWIFNDSNKFDKETLTTIYSWLPQNNKASIGEAFNTTFSYLVKQWYVYLYLVLIIMLIKFGNLKAVIFSALSFCLSCGLTGYLIYVNRLVGRVLFGIWFVPIILSIVFLSYLFEHKDLLANKFILIACCIGLGIFFVFQINANKEEHPYSSETVNLMDYLSQYPDNVYIFDTLSVQGSYIKWRPYVAPTKEYMGNFIYAGGWEVDSPVLREKQSELGIDNPLESLITKENCYYVYVDAPIDELALYFEENYGVKAHIEEADHYSWFKVYKISVE